MKEYTFDHTEDSEYEVVVPKDVVDEIIKDYRERHFYISVALMSGIIGFLLGVLVA